MSINIKRIYNDVSALKLRVAGIETAEPPLIWKMSSVTNAGDYRGRILITGTGSQSGLVATQLVYMDDTEQWRKVHAGRTDAGAGNILGIAISETPHTDGVLVEGICKLAGSYTSGHHDGGNTFTPTGSHVYMHNVTSGSYTSILPSGSGEIVRVVGHSIGEDMVYFNPSQDYIEV